MQRTTFASLLALAALTPLSSSQTHGWPRGPVDPGAVRLADRHGVEARAWADDRAESAGLPGHAAALSGAGWTALGPFGGDADDVAASPTAGGVVLCGIAPSGGVGGTLYRSTDGGATWAEVLALSGTSVHDVEFAADGTAWIGTFDGAWSSVDDGVTWTQHPLGIGANDQVFEVTLDPGDPDRVWVGVADAVGSQTRNVLLSTDGGGTWQDVTPAGAAGTSCRAIAVDPGDSSEVFAGFGGAFGGGSVWRSTNGGASWTNVTGVLPANPMKDLHHDGTRVLVCGGQLFGSQVVGLFETTDGGATWSALHDGSWPSLVLHDVEVDPADPDTIWVASAGSGAFRSSDGGASWTFGLGGALALNEVEVDPSGGAPVWLAGSSTAVTKSADGATFAPSSVGIGSLNVVSVAIDPLDDGHLAVAFQGLNDGGVYTSVDGGASWALEALPGTRFNTVGFAPDGTLYAISDGPTTIAAEGLWRREGDGSWTSLGPDQGSAFESELFALAFGEVDPGLIVTGGSDFGVAGFEMTMWRSTDGGATWTKAYEGTDNEDAREVVIVPDGTEATLVAAYTDFGTGQSGGALRSTDGGATWAPSGTGLAAGAQCWGVAASRLDASTLFLADDDVPAGAVYRSTDAGATWQPMGFSGRARDVETSPLRPDRLFVAASTGAKVLVSEDAGATTAPFDAGLDAGGAGAPAALALAPGACNRLLLATSTGVYAEDEAGCRLEADVDQLSVSAGGTTALDLAAGPAEAGHLYLVLGSAVGTEPGLTVGAITVPLVVDPLLLATINEANSAIFPGTLGTLSPEGRGSAAIVLPAASPPSLVGATTWWAFGTFTLGPLVTYVASNPVAIELIP